MANDSAQRPSPVTECTATAIESRLRQVLTPTHLQVTDDSAAHRGHAGSNGSDFGTHFKVSIGSAAFNGLSRVAAHRLVYDALRDFTEAGLHALAIDIRR